MQKEILTNNILVKSLENKKHHHLSSSEGFFLSWSYQYQLLPSKIAVKMVGKVGWDFLLL